MSSLARRQAFADFLTRLATDAECEGEVEWSRLVIAHYRDDEVELIRAELVRLSIKRNPTGAAHAWQPEDREQMLKWAEQLRRPPAE